MIQHCPVCTEPVVRCGGSEESKILFVLSKPNDEDLHYYKPLSGALGSIFKRELYKHAKLEMLECRIVPYWFHEPTKDERCLQVSREIVSAEMENKTKIILIESEAVKFYTGHKVDEVTGMAVPVDYDNFGVQEMFCMINPSYIYAKGKGIGELRFALKKLGEWANE